MKATFLFLLAACLWCVAAPARSAPRPNIVFILADDLGYSDPGCYGGEIGTPHLDALAAGGVRFTQFYNTARCWPSRAALLTGFYAQQVHRDALPEVFGGARGVRQKWAPLLPAMLRPAGYRSYVSGKWHVDGDPLAQGFDRARIVNDGDGSTGTANHAIECLREHAAQHAEQPFFQYIAFHAPHFPLHASPEDIALYRDKYLHGWDAMREARFARQKEMGLTTTTLSPLERETGPPHVQAGVLEKLGPGEINRPLPWAELNEEQRRFQAMKMSIHAAMVHRMDLEIGRVVAQLKAMGAWENTLILFASDNGASAEMLVRGRGHDPAATPGSAATHLCLGPGFSSACNTPHRRHKTWVHEGGIATPLIVHWPAGIAARGELRHTPAHLIDFVPTVFALTGVERPHFDDAPAAPGRNLLPAFAKDVTIARDSLWWLHEGHRAVRAGDWKLVALKGAPWELYDLKTDRAEQHDLAAKMPDKAQELAAVWQRQTDEFTALSKKTARAAPPPPAPQAEKPNVIVIMADDLGYGDVSCYGGKVPSPAIDRLAGEGLRFTSGYCSASTCTPTRFSLLTGTYAFRQKGTGIAPPNGPAIIKPGTETLPGILQRAGYATAVIGKWHLGLGDPAPDWNGELKPGPLDIGFDHCFLLPTTNDRVPQVFVEGRRVKNLDPADPLWVGDTAPPGDHPTGLSHRDTLKLDWSHGHNQTIHNGISRIGFYTGGTKARFRDEDLADAWVQESNRWIEANKDRPFFLYFAAQDIHVPRIAHERFQGKSGHGPRGDCILQFDWSVGELTKTLDRLGLAEKTLIVICSDNGPVLDDGYKDDAVEKLGAHKPAGPFRGGKYSVWEGGTRTPFITRWKGRIAPAVSDAAVCTVDFAASFAALAGQPMPADGCLDSLNILDALLGKPAAKGRDHVLQQDNGSGNYGLRAGDWKLVRLKQRGKAQARVSKDERPLPAAVHTLYKLSDDPGEQTDVSAAHPEIVQRLTAQMDQLLSGSRSR